MFDDSGYRHLRVKVVVPDRLRSAEVLGWIFEDPEVSATVVEAGAIGGGAFFKVEVFGVGSKVDALLSRDWVGGPTVRGACRSEVEPRPQDDVQDTAPVFPAAPEGLENHLVFGKL